LPPCPVGIHDGGQVDIGHRVAINKHKVVFDDILRADKTNKSAAYLMRKPFFQHDLCANPNPKKAQLYVLINNVHVKKLWCLPVCK